MLRLPHSLLAAVAATSPAVPQDLDRARELLADRMERQVQEGAAICVEADSVEAVEVLLEVMHQTERRTHLHLAPAHYRDIAWDALVAIRDPYARRRVELELKTGKSPRVRQWCAELLGIYGDRGFGETLNRALGAKQDYIVQWAARSLGMLKFEPAAKKLLTRARHKNGFVRANAIEALARIDDERYLQQLQAAIEGDRDGGVRCALLGALADIDPDAAEAASIGALRDPDWRPRMQAVQSLGKIKTKTSVDNLIVALKDGRPVVASRALRELQELTGQPISQPEIWPKWWADNRESFGFPDKRGTAERDAGRTVAYNGVPVDSDHVAFLIDKSYQMQERLSSKGLDKEEAAVAELGRVLELLEDRLVFNVVNYHTELEAFRKKPVELGPKIRKRVLVFAAAPSKGKAKNIWQALETVVSDPTLDTLYLLSSGEPDVGLYVHWNRVTRHLADLNRFHKVTVHCVAYTDNEWYRDQLQKIAEVTGGHFEWLQ